MSYYAYEVPAVIRQDLVDAFPPKFPDFIGHHITAWFGSKLPEGVPIADLVSVKVIGYAADASLEALVVSVDDSTRRADNKIYHITWSLDRSAGRKPVDSNAVIASGYQDIHPHPPFLARLKKF